MVDTEGDQGVHAPPPRSPCPVGGRVAQGRGKEKGEERKERGREGKGGGREGKRGERRGRRGCPPTAIPGSASVTNPFSARAHSLQLSPRPLAGFKGSILLREGREGRGRKRKGRKRERRGGRGRRGWPPQWQFLDPRLSRLVPC